MRSWSRLTGVLTRRGETPGEQVHKEEAKWGHGMESPSASQGGREDMSEPNAPHLDLGPPDSTALGNRFSGLSHPVCSILWRQREWWYSCFLNVKGMNQMSSWGQHTQGRSCSQSLPNGIANPRTVELQLFKCRWCNTIFFYTSNRTRCFKVKDGL